MAGSTTISISMSVPGSVAVSSVMPTLKWRGNCLAASATRGGHTLIAVELGVRGSEFAAASRMLDWGFHKVAQ